MFEDDWGGSAQDYSDPYDSIPFGDAQRWEDDRVFEDMAIERREAEAEAIDESIVAEVREVVEHVAASLPEMPLDIIERIAERIIDYQWSQREAGPADPEEAEADSA